MGGEHGLGQDTNEGFLTTIGIGQHPYEETEKGENEENNS
jgi:hypothetical protein